MKSKNKLAALAAFSCGIAVIFLALAAHALKNVLEPDKVSAITTAAQIQLIHGIAILIIYRSDDILLEKLKSASRLIFWGSFIFSFSIYFLATVPLTGLQFFKVLGPVTPLGGLLLISGWMLAGIKLLKSDS